MRSGLDHRIGCAVTSGGNVHSGMKGILPFDMCIKSYLSKTTAHTLYSELLLNKLDDESCGPACNGCAILHFRLLSSGLKNLNTICF